MSRLNCDEVRDLAPAFVLGALEPVQILDVRDHLGTCPEPHPEMGELGGVLPYLAESIEPVEPPAELRGRILGVIDAEVRAGRRTEAAADRLITSLAAGSPGRVAAEPGPVGGPTPEAAVRLAPGSVGRLATEAPIDLAAERARRRSPLRWIAAIAAVLVIAALGAWNIGLSQQLSTAQQQQAAVDHVLAIAQQAGGQAAVMAPGSSGGPTGLAAVGSDGSFALALSGLPATSGTQVYEAWIIAPSGSPVPVGSFAVGSSGLGALTAAQVPTGTGVTVGLTREPHSGVTTPTLPMVVSGVATRGG
jgi:anti-sigma factor ChrR (cupin superfamily)